MGGQSCQKSMPLGELLFLKSDKNISLQQAFDTGFEDPVRLLKRTLNFVSFNKNFFIFPTGN